MRREAFEMVGGFDESFFLYYEEADLCYRLQKLGWQVHFAPVTEITHFGAASTCQRNGDMKVQLFSSLMQFYRKHYTRTDRAELAVLIESVALARFVRDLISLRVTADLERRTELESNISAWRRLLRGHWRRRFVYG